MLPKARIPLKERLVLAFLSVVLISLFLSVTFSYLVFIVKLNKKLDPDIKESSDTIEARITDVKERALIYADIITRDRSVASYLKGEIPRETLIEALRRINSKTGLEIMQVIDTEGRVKLRIEDLAAFDDVKLEDPFVIKSLKGFKTASFQVEDNQLGILASVPISEDGKTYGVLLTGFTVSDELLTKIEGPIDKDITIFNTSGVVIATTIRDQKGTRVKDQGIDNDAIKKVKEGEEISEQVKINNEYYRALFTPVRDTNNNVIAIRSTFIRLKPIVSDNTSTIITLILANLVTILVAYITAVKSSKKLVGPVLTIKKGTEIIGAGNLRYKINLQTNDELEDLASSFNEMAGKLNDLLSEVEKEKNKISAERNKFSIVLEGVLDGIFTLNYERRITLFNKAASEITGLTSEEVIGKKCDEVLIIFRNKTRLPSSDFCPLIPSEKDQIIFADKNLKLVTNKKELYISMNSAVIKEGKIADLGCIVTFRDSSKERELEEMKLDFVSMAAHELRTPLTTIRGYMSILEPRIKGKITEEEVKFLERVSISANQLASLVENLLDVSKIEHNTLELEIKPEEWVTIVNETINNFSELSKQKNIPIRFNPPKPSLPKVAVDKFRISEVLSNLLANALNYTEPDGLIEITLREKDGMVETSVKDTGCGVPERSIPHLFTKFYRVSGVLEEGSKGTGLGLFISKSIVTMHKGEIWVESELGVGSTFTFSIPIYKGEKSGI